MARLLITGGAGFIGSHTCLVLLEAGRQLVVLDNYATHKTPQIKKWLVKHPRFHLHFVPTSASWLNQVERWFGLITQQAIRRGNFSSVKELIAKIEQFVAAYNKSKAPFNWTATAD